jgi:hypothetical protein
MRTSFLVAVVVGLGALVGCGGDDETDSFEASYARASCERSFECYPDVRRYYDSNIDGCIGLKLSLYRDRRNAYGQVCADATLDQWACEGVAICGTETDLAGPCGYALARVRAACPDASTSP